MAKELPYYKHEPSEWLEGEIQVCSDAAIVCFLNLRDGYWVKLGCMSYAFALQKYCRKDASIIQELIDNGIIDLQGDDIKIKFLDKQLEEVKITSEKRRKAAEKRWNDASEMQVHSKSNAIRKEEIRENNKLSIEQEFEGENKKYLDFTHRFYERLKEENKAKPTESVSKTKVHEIRKLHEVDGYEWDKIIKVAKYYLDNIHESYAPQAYGAKSFREKYLNIRDFCQRHANT